LLSSAKTKDPSAARRRNRRIASAAELARSALSTTLVCGSSAAVPPAVTIIEARTQGVSDPTAADSALFETAGMRALGVGPVMTPTVRFRRFPGPARGGGNGVLGIVALDGVISPQGKTSELEILASSNPTFNQAALQWASHLQTMTQRRPRTAARRNRTR
jgi:hypothetical protein